VGDPRPKPGPAPIAPPASAAPARPGIVRDPAHATGRVARDERGNAVWDFLRSAKRAATDTTSRLLRRLEAPELSVEAPEEEELRLEPDTKAGGYDPYNQAARPRSRSK